MPKSTIMSNIHVLDIFIYNVRYLRAWEMKLLGGIYFCMYIHEVPWY